MGPADLMCQDESVPSAQASLQTQCYRVYTVLASPSLSTMLSNKAPNLEAKMEKGISNNQKGGGGSTFTKPHVSMKSNHQKETVLFSPNSGHLSSSPSSERGLLQGNVSGGGWWLEGRNQILSQNRSRTTATSGFCSSKPSVGKGRTPSSHFLPAWRVLS